jgi:hypothetical protein
MPTRLVPAVVVVVLLVTSPIAAATAVPAAAIQDDGGGSSGAGGAAGSGSGSASGSVGSSGVAADANASNASVVPGSGGIIAAAEAPDGGQYLAGVTGLAAPNRTLTRIGPNGTVTWQRTLADATESRVPQAIASAPSGAVYLLERVGEPRTVSGPPTEQRPQAELSRIAPDGSVVWTRSLGNATLSSRAGGLRATDDGVVLARPAPGGERERERTRLQRYSPTGAVDWSRTYAGGQARALAVRPEGGYLVAGQRDFGSAWLLAVNDSGTVLLNESYGTVQDREVTGVVPTADGGALLGGSAETHFAGSDPWVARVDDEGVVRWSRTYGDAAGARVYREAAVRTDAGILVVNRLNGDRQRGTLLTHVTPDGAVGERAITNDQLAATPLVTGEELRLYGLRFDRRNRTTTGTVRSVGLPTPAPDERPVHATVTSNETFYRGQNLRLPGGNVTHELYELPTEYSDFEEPRLIRRIGPDADGNLTFESATLSSGRYAVRATPDYWLRIEADGYRLTGNASRAAFELADHDIYRLEANRTVVERYAGERRVRVRVRTDPTGLPLRVGLSRLNGTSVATDDLRAALAPQPDAAAAVTTVDGRATAPVTLPADGNLTLDAGALPAGLYELSATGVETADATDPAETRLVVVREERPVDLVPANRSVTATANRSGTTDLRLVGVDEGIGALRLGANSTAPPAVRLDMEFTDAVDYSSASGSAGLSPRGATAEVQSLEIRESPTGNVTVARLTVGPTDFGRFDEEPTDDSATRTATVTVAPVFVVDAAGVPYSVSEGTTVTVELPAADGDGTDST